MKNHEGKKSQQKAKHSAVKEKGHKCVARRQKKAFESDDEGESQPAPKRQNTRRSTLTSESPQCSSSPLDESSWNDIIFDEDWTRNDERVIRNWWTEKETATLNNTSANELAAWRRAHQRFDMAPPDLVPGKGMDTSTNDAYDDDTSVINWSGSSAQELNYLLCCPAFDDRPGFLTYCLAKAVAIRLGTWEPSKKEAYGDRNEKFLAALEQNLVSELGYSDGHVSEDAQRVIPQTTIEIFGKDIPQHFEFVDGDALACAVRELAAPRGRVKNKRPEGVTVGDMRTIRLAWDTYALAKKTKHLGLPTMANALQNLKNKRGAAPAGELSYSEEAKLLKKEWYFRATRDALQKGN